jgi:phage repressor protein C with HTH and peptisase S24 domain
MQNSGNIHERISLLVEKFGEGKNTVFASMIKSNEGNVRGYIKGVVPKHDVLEKIATNLDINPEWLLTGKGEMLKSAENPVQKNLPEHRPKGIPLIPVNAMAGYGGGDVQVMDYDIQENYLVTPELDNKGVQYLIRASGSSMTPKYNNGDLLACRPITDITFMQWGKVYVLDTDQGPLVKRLYECNPADGDCLECRSDNSQKYPPFKISKSSIRRIAIVVGVLRME